MKQTKSFKVLEVEEDYYNTLSTHQKEVLRAMDERLDKQKEWTLSHPSEKNFSRLNELTGVEYDWSDRDFGEPPAKYNNY